MFMLVILLLMEVKGNQEQELGCSAAFSQNLASDQSSSCLSQPTTKVCLGEVQLQNVLEAGLEEKCNEEEGEIEKGKSGKGEEGELEKEEVMKMKSGCLFLLETSTRGVLTSREACALESAARNSGLL